jgi:hypothetical protein
MKRDRATALAVIYHGFGCCPLEGAARVSPEFAGPARSNHNWHKSCSHSSGRAYRAAADISNGGGENPTCDVSCLPILLATHQTSHRQEGHLPVRRLTASARPALLRASKGSYIGASLPWGRSSVGRARGLHPRGCRFDPGRLHLRSPVDQRCQQGFSLDHASTCGDGRRVVRIPGSACSLVYN